MRRVTVTLGGKAIECRIPVPSVSARLVQSVRVEGLAEQEAASVALLQSVAVDAWPWPGTPAEAWAAMWDEGVALSELSEAVTTWMGAYSKAMGVVEAASAKADTFPDRPAGVGGDAP